MDEKECAILKSLSDQKHRQEIRDLVAQRELVSPSRRIILQEECDRMKASGMPLQNVVGHEDWAKEVGLRLRKKKLGTPVDT